MKKTISLVTLLLLALVLVACNKTSAKINGVSDVTIEQGSSFDPMAGVTATDSKDGDITNKIAVDGTVNVNVPDVYNLKYRVTGSDGKEVSKSRKVTVTAKNSDTTASFSGVQDITVQTGSSFNPMDGVSATDLVDGDITDKITVTGVVNTNVNNVYTLTYKVTGSDGNEVTATRKVTVTGGTSTPPTEIVIMHGAPYEVDPYHANYTGTETLQRQQKQDEVEARLNVKVVYKAYPSNAAWGPDRVNAIIQASVSGNPLADIYWTTSDWIQQLVKGNAIVDVTKYLGTHGKNITTETVNLGSYQNGFYGFSTGKPTVDVGLYFNMDLIDQLGVANPTRLFLDGQWTWAKFDEWATQVQTALNSKGDGWHALGGVPAVYAENMIPLNGGSLINVNTKRVGFHQAPAYNTYNFLTDLYQRGLFEAAGTYDSGSPQWQAGQVAIHPGSFWFLNADNRWKNLNFQLGFVPYPRGNSYQGPYVSPVSGVALYNIAAGLSAQKEELAFQVWNELQLWKSEAQFKDDFEATLLTRFDELDSVDAYLEIFDKTAVDLIGALGISRYDSQYGFYSMMNAAIKEGTARTVAESIEPAYTAALEAYFGTN